MKVKIEFMIRCVLLNSNENSKRNLFVKLLL